MAFIIKARFKGTKERFTNVTRGSGDGGGTRTFKTIRQAQNYARDLPSFETKILPRPVRRKKSNMNVFDSFKGF